MISIPITFLLEVNSVVDLLNLPQGYIATIQPVSLDYQHPVFWERDWRFINVPVQGARFEVEKFSFKCADTCASATETDFDQYGGPYEVFTTPDDYSIAC